MRCWVSGSIVKPKLGRETHGAEAAYGVGRDGVGAYGPQDTVAEVDPAVEGV